MAAMTEAFKAVDLCCDQISKIVTDILVGK